MYRCCIFDLDGTLLNTLGALTTTVNGMLRTFDYPPLDEAHVKQFVGDGYKNLVKRALLYSGDEGLDHYEEGLTVYTKEFAIHSMDGVRPYEGIVELLEELKRRKILIAVLSNKPHERTVENIEAVFGTGYFDYIAGEQEGVPRKPDPAGVVRILESFQVNPKECVYFGDTNTDMKTGLSAGLSTAGVTWGFRDRAELEAYEPQWILDHPSQAISEIFCEP